MRISRAQTGGDARAIAEAAVRNLWPLFDHHYDQLLEAVRGLPGPILEPGWPVAFDVSASAPGAG